MKNTLYAIHRDGARLYLPRWDADGEIIASKLPAAAGTLTSEGVTFHDGSTWIRKPRGRGLLDGWKIRLGSHEEGRKAVSQVVKPEAHLLTFLEDPSCDCRWPKMIFNQHVRSTRLLSFAAERGKHPVTRSGVRRLLFPST